MTGGQAFKGETVTDVLASVVKEDPPVAVLPLRVRAVVARCLSKDPRTRWRDIADVRWALDQHDAEPPLPAPPARHPWPWMIAALFALAALPAAWFLKPKPEEPLLQVEISPPEGVKLGAVNFGQFELSPDGRRIVFLGHRSNGISMLWIRWLGGTDTAPLAGTEGAFSPFWSPDSRWIGFFANGKLLKIDANGGQPQILAEASTPLLHGTWNSEGVILFAETAKPIQRVSAAGGTPEPVFSPDSAHEETQQRAPWFLPDGKHFLFDSNAKQSGIILGSLDGKTRRFLFPQRLSPASYVPNPAGGGWILYIGGSDETQLMARPFDPAKGEFTAEAVAVADPLFRGPSWSASANGLLAFRRLRQGETQLTWFNRDGKQLGVAGDSGIPGSIRGTRGTFPRISPDQKTVVFARRSGDGNTDLWLFDIVRSATTRFTFGPGANGCPLWSPDGSHIIYFSERATGVSFLVERPANGIGPDTAVKSGLGIFAPSGISRDDRWIVTEGYGRIEFVPRANGKSFSFPGSGYAANGSISPDGRWLLYSEGSFDRRAVNVHSVPKELGGSPSAEGKWQISTAGGANPVWRGDGKEIFYLANDGKMMAVPVESGENFFRPGTPKPLFQTQLPQTSTRDYDVTADGQRFLIDQPLASDQGEVPISVVVNWPKLLQK